jgi:hypothetical protein
MGAPSECAATSGGSSALFEHTPSFTSRETTDHGQVVARLGDYRVIYDLISELIARSSGQMIPKEIRPLSARAARSGYPFGVAYYSVRSVMLNQLPELSRNVASIP